MKSKKKKIIKLLVCIAIIAIASVFGIISKEEVLALLSKSIVENVSQNATKTAESKKVYEIIKVVDGDTIQIKYNGKKERVRLIGIDTPESVHPDEEKNTEYGKMASEYTKSLLEGKKVSLEFDVEKRDKYDRLLAYVYLDGEMVNKKLLAEGYARLETVPPNVKYVEEFKDALKNAKEAKKGLWKFIL